MKTIEQLEKENKILKSVLHEIANNFSDPQEIADQAEERYGLNYEEALEMAYENVLGKARWALNVTKK